VEIVSWNRVVVHEDVSETVDRMLRGLPVSPEHRALEPDGTVSKVRPEIRRAPANGGAVQYPSLPYSAEGQRADEPAIQELEPVQQTAIMPYGVNKGKLQQVVRVTSAPVKLVDDIDRADVLLTTKNYYRRKTNALQTAEQKGKPVYVLRRNTTPQIEQFVRAITRRNNIPQRTRALDRAVQEAEEAARRIERGEHRVDLTQQRAYIRHLQHEVAEKFGLASSSTGEEPSRHVVFYRR
jgi:hypothetical protein